MPNLSSLVPATTAALALSNLVLVSPGDTVGYQPQNPPNADGTLSTAQQPPTFLFHYEGEQVVSVESDITDHYVEDNTAVADQIALKPEQYRTQGFIGELNDVVPGLLRPIKAIADKLTTIGAYEPQVSTTALIAYNEAFFLYQTAERTANAAVAAWSSITNLFTGEEAQSVVTESGISEGTTQNKQQAAFAKLYGYWRSRTLFTIQTPWAVFTDMAIMKMEAIQDAETNVITDFRVVFKMIRRAVTEETLVASSFSNGNQYASLQGRAGAQSAVGTNNGASTPVDDISLTDGLTSMGVA